MKKLLLIIIILISLTGCTDSNVSNNKPNIPTNQQDILDFGRKFVPTDFLIKDFTIDIEENVIVYKVKFYISPELYNFLKENNIEYYFHLEYPERVTNITGKTISQMIKHTPTSSRQTYTLEFKETVMSDKSSELLQIKKDELGYKLIVTNKEKYPVSIFDDIEVLSHMTKDSNIIDGN